MLILPLHHRVEARHLPWMSLLIALLCAFIHVGPQQGDVERVARAEAQYGEAGLEALEAPLYAAYAEAHPEALLHAADVDMAVEAAAVMRTDRAFRAALLAGKGFADEAAHQEWMRRSETFRRTLASLVNERFSVHADAPTTLQAFTSAFLHGDAGHLFGNLLFLLALGLLVERALGPWIFFLVYAASAVVAAWFWALSKGAVPVSALGASGAIAGLMGALCVLWGTRRIRFFYWFIVVFDYVRAPALWLLPAWLGWELFQWASDDASNVAYQAHVGGILAGALLAGGIKAMRWDRADAYAAAEADEPIVAGAGLANAQAALGRLDFSAVERELAPLLAQVPAPIDARVLALRAAQMRGAPAGAAQVVGASALEHAAALLREVRTMDRHKALEALAGWRRSGGRWRPEEAFAHAKLLVAAGRVGDAVDLLREAVADAGEPAALPEGWAARWLRLGFDLRQDGDAAAARALFQALAAALPATPEGVKATAQLDG